MLGGLNGVSNLHPDDWLSHALRTAAKNFGDFWHKKRTQKAGPHETGKASE